MARCSVRRSVVIVCRGDWRLGFGGIGVWSLEGSASGVWRDLRLEFGGIGVWSLEGSASGVWRDRRLEVGGIGRLERSATAVRKQDVFRSENRRMNAHVSGLPYLYMKAHVRVT